MVLGHISCWLLLLPIAACSAPQAFLGHVPLQQVVVHNPSRAMLVANCVEAWHPAWLRLGDATEYRLNLLPGRWELQATLSEVHWGVPLPLPLSALRPAVVHVTIAPPPGPRVGLAWIPPGPALVGDVLGVGQEDERPARVLDVAGFWISTTEITNAEFADFLNGVGEVQTDWLDLDSRKCRIHRGADGHYATDAGTLPVVTVSYRGAVAYCEWQTRAKGRRHRLPSEIEWEKAARGPASATYSYGDTFTQDAANQESGELCPIAEHQANGFGLFDMTGNAFEWVADVYDRAAYAKEAISADGEYRVLRGGSFVLDGMFLRNSMRMKLRPGVRADDVGFRVVMEIEEFGR
jgi:formylglycine-generating enzyme required for sulfatase activity